MFKELQIKMEPDLGTSWGKIQAAHSRFIKAQQNFKKLYVDKSTDEMNMGKVSRAFKNTDPANKLINANAEIELLSSMKNLDDLLRKEGKALGESRALPDKKIFGKPFLTALQDVRAAHSVLKGIGSSPVTAREGGFRGALQAAGGLAAGAVYQPAWFLGAMGGGAAGVSASRNASRPLSHFRELQTIASGVSEQRSTLKSIINSITKATRPIRGATESLMVGTDKPSMSRALSITGLEDMGGVSKKDQINKIIEQVSRIGTPERIAELKYDLEGATPKVASSLENQMKVLSEFALRELPNKYEEGSYRRPTREDVRKTAETIEIVFEPLKALKRAIKDGDLQTLSKLAEAHPGVMQKFKEDLAMEAIQEGGLDKLPAKEKAILQWASAGNASSSDLEAVPSIREVYANLNAERDEQQAEQQAVRQGKIKSLESQRPKTTSERMAERS